MLANFNLLHHLPKGCTVTGTIFTHYPDLLGALSLWGDKPEQASALPRSPSSGPPRAPDRAAKRSAPKRAAAADQRLPAAHETARGSGRRGRPASAGAPRAKGRSPAAEPSNGTSSLRRRPLSRGTAPPPPFRALRREPGASRPADACGPRPAIPPLRPPAPAAARPALSPARGPGPPGAEPTQGAVPQAAPRPRRGWRRMGRGGPAALTIVPPGSGAERGGSGAQAHYELSPPPEVRGGARSVCAPAPWVRQPHGSGASRASAPRQLGHRRVSWGSQAVAQRRHPRGWRQGREGAGQFHARSSVLTWEVQGADAPMKKGTAARVEVREKSNKAKIHT